ncbi:MAG TPA: metalloregulator ArsR/SmtB family transcription factor, partial [Acidimicrobiales bacterium]
QARADDTVLQHRAVQGSIRFVLAPANSRLSTLKSRALKGGFFNSLLGDPTRRAIFEHLGEQPSAVVDLAARVPVSRPAVSQHLKVLKEAGLVRDTQVGTRRIYSLDPDGIAALRDYLDRFWNTALHSFKKRVEQLQEETNQ